MQPSARPPDVATHGRALAYVLLVGVSVVWGLHWVVAKVGLETMPPFQYGMLRILTGLAVLVGILAARRDLRVPSRADLPIVLSVGLGPIASGIALMNLALLVVPAGRSSILVYTMPIWVAVLGALFFGMRPGRLELGGVALGFLGIVLLLNPAVIDWSTEGEVAGVAMLLVNAVVWALAAIHIRRHTWHASPLELQPWQLLVAVVPLAVLALVFDAGASIDWTPQTVLVLLYSGPVATAFAYWASQSVTRSLGPLASTTGFLAVPVVGLLAGSVLLGESLGPVDAAGFALVLGGVAATSLGARRAAGASESAAEAESPVGA
jgi:drug/metabolite transporter (DMT)-like permease